MEKKALIQSKSHYPKGKNFSNIQEKLESQRDIILNKRIEEDMPNSQQISRKNYRDGCFSGSPRDNFPSKYHHEEDEIDFEQIAKQTTLNFAKRS